MTVYVAVSGHRPDKVGGYRVNTMPRLATFARRELPQLLRALGGSECHVRTGMALGWDQAVAAACCTLGMPYTAVIPFHGQDAKWPAESRRAYDALLRRAAAVEDANPDLTANPAARGYGVVAEAMHTRNRLLLEFGPQRTTYATALVALWNGTAGGTKDTVQLAKLLSVPTHNLWESWQTFAGG